MILGEDATMAGEATIATKTKAIKKSCMKTFSNSKVAAYLNVSSVTSQSAFGIL
jgi:hypothetical protein